MYTCEYLIIGGGKTGIKVANELNKTGRNIVLVEEKRLGGNTLNQVDIPQEAYHYETKLLSGLARYFADEGKPAQNLYEVKKIVVERAKQKISSKAKKLAHSMEKLDKVKVVFAKASLVTKNIAEVSIDNKRIEIKFKTCFICTGKDNIMTPMISGLDSVSFLNKYSVFSINSLPLSLGIIGLNETSINVASIYSSLGVKVVIFEKYSRAKTMQAVDIDLINYVVHKLQSNFVTVEFETEIVEVKPNDDGVIMVDIFGNQHCVDNIYVDCPEGFDPETLKLGNVKIKSSTDGIAVDKNNLTKLKNIYALGSCADIKGMKVDVVSLLQAIISKDKKKRVDREKQLIVRFVHSTLDAFQPIKVPPNYYKFELKYSINCVGLGLTERQATGKYGPKVKTTMIYSHGNSEFIKILYFENSQKIIGCWATSYYKHHFESLLVYGMEVKSNTSDIVSIIKKSQKVSEFI